MAENNLNKKAGKAGIWYTTANIFLKGCLFLTLPIFTRLLSPHDFGIYNTYMAYEALLSAILGLGLYGTVKNAKLDYGEDFNSYMSSVLTLSLICFSLLICVINLFWNLIQPYWQFSLFVTNCLLLQSYGAFVLFFYGSKLNIEFKYKSYVAISFIDNIGQMIPMFTLK